MNDLLGRVKLKTVIEPKNRKAENSFCLTSIKFFIFAFSK
jgi:hypothetical protein